MCAEGTCEQHGRSKEKESVTDWSETSVSYLSHNTASKHVPSVYYLWKHWTPSVWKRKQCQSQHLWHPEIWFCELQERNLILKLFEALYGLLKHYRRSLSNLSKSHPQCTDWYCDVHLGCYYRSCHTNMNKHIQIKVSQEGAHFKIWMNYSLLAMHENGIHRQNANETNS